MSCGKPSEEKKEEKMKKIILTTALAVGTLFLSANALTQELLVDNSEENGYFMDDCSNENGDYVKVNHKPTRSPIGVAEVYLKVKGVKSEFVTNFEEESSISMKKTTYEIPDSSLQIVTKYGNTPECPIHSRAPCFSRISKTIKTALLKVNDYEIILQCK
jgi:hypothetical protein